MELRQSGPSSHEDYFMQPLTESIASGNDGGEEMDYLINSTAVSEQGRPGLQRNVTVFEPWVESERSDVLNIPKRAFRWIYSISLVIFSIVTLVFAAITIVDVIAQTSGTSFSGIKLFIVIIVCVVFVIVSLFLYFLRILQARIALNDIPSKSVYIPFEGDYPHDVFVSIDEKLKECYDIRVEAGPLSDPTIIINHPGLSPPEYIQERNLQISDQGAMLPPDSVYEEIIRSIGDKFLTDKYKVFSPIDIPTQLTFREIIIYLSKIYIVNANVPSKQLPDLDRLIELYEKFRFGPSLIQDSELIEFIINFDKFALMCQSDYQQNLPQLAKSSKLSVDNFANYDLVSAIRPDYNYYDYDSDSQSQSQSHTHTSAHSLALTRSHSPLDISPDDSMPEHFHHGAVDSKYYDKISDYEDSLKVSPNEVDMDDANSVINLRTGKNSKSQQTLLSTWSSLSKPSYPYGRNSASSLKSVIKMKLALKAQKTNSYEDVDKRYSGYTSDIENEQELLRHRNTHNGQPEPEDDDDEDEDILELYKFRKRRN